MAYVVGLTGGIGSGKSTVSQMLVDRGAILIDADAIVHELQEPGTVVFDEMVEAFGPEIVGPDGRLDRPKVASIVFADEEKRLKLNSIVHPRVGEVVLQRLRDAKEHDIVVVDIPLLTENTRAERGLSKVIVIDVPEELQVERAVARGMDEADVRERMSRQSSREERIALADHVLDNSGTVDALAEQVDDLWAELKAEADK